LSQKRLILSGFSGVGKSAVIEELLREGHIIVPSYTTRLPREGEDNSKYIFISKREFFRKISLNEMIEYNKYGNEYYGTPRMEMEILANEKAYIYEVDVNGCTRLKKEYPDAVSIFLIPPSAEELVKRLCGRGSEGIREQVMRLERAIQEAEYFMIYDHVIVNHDIRTCMEQVNMAIFGEGIEGSDFHVATFQKELKRAIAYLSEKVCK